MGRETMMYRLDGKKPVPCGGLAEYARWRATEPDTVTRVAKTEAEGILVSTVFLGIDHNWTGHGPPIVFETMVFGLPALEGYQERYATWDAAEAGHQEAVKAVRDTLNQEAGAMATEADG